jgi:formylglycine-generating enzyme required for sulfatase activity/serine/threonine protein kinase
MPTTAACPDLTQYKKLASGELFSPEKDAVLDHLEGCDACATQVEGLSENDTLVELIRQASARGQPPGSEAVVRLVERFRKLRPGDDGAPETENFSPGKTGPAPRLTFTCPSCGKQVRTTTEWAGKKGKCPHCKQVVGVPEQAVGSSDRELYDFLAPPQAPDEMGRLGPYRVLEVLGQGGMGIVFRAEDPHLNRLVALKAMLPKMAAAKTGRERFLREARSMAAIKHDHIVSIYQVGEEKGVPYLAMEFLEGEPLDSRLRRERKLPVTEVLRIGHQMARGLAAAHSRGLLHRDIKPANLWLENLGEWAVWPARGRLKILDFGLARAVQERSPLSQPGLIVGTPEYMAPEQAEGKALDHRCDLFSLGCVLYQMSTGESPFRRADLMSTLSALANKDPVAPCELEPSVPPALSKLILQLLAKQPEKRPESAQAVADALERMAWRVESRAASTTAVNSPTAVKRRSSKDRRPQPRSHRWAVNLPAAVKKRWRIGAPVATCVLLMGLAFLWAGGVFRVKTPVGILVVNVNEPNPNVYVNGEIVTVTWENSGTKAEIRRKPGTYKVEIKKDGFTACGEEVTLEAGGSRIITARLEPPPPETPAPSRPLSVPPVTGARAEVKDSDKTPEATRKMGPGQPATGPSKPADLALDLGDGVKMEFARIPAGEFMMGKPDSEPKARQDTGPYQEQTEKPQHRVTISKDFYMGIYLVTQEQYKKVMGWNPSYFSAEGEGKSKVNGIDTGQFPVETVSWDDAEKFCQKLSELTGRRCTLPTEAQWEYACRAGTTTSFHFGTSLDGTQANCDGNIPYGTEEKGPYLGRTCPVGSYPPNAFGLYDMHGNVCQWCADYCDLQPYSVSVTVDPQGPANGPLRAARGGGWDHSAWGCRAAYRPGSGASHSHTGFRVVCTAPLPEVTAPPRPLPVPPVTGARADVKRSDLTLDLGDGVKIEFARIPAGEFMMGSPDSELKAREDGTPMFTSKPVCTRERIDEESRKEKPQHRVTITKDFYMGIYQVTQEQYKKVIGWNPSYFSAAGKGRSKVEGMDTSRFPVENVSWDDAQVFCRRLSQLTGRSCALPTEAQWEYACRAGTRTPFHFGTELNGTQANCDGNYPYGTEKKGPYLERTCPVGSYPPNAFGLYDMHGNVNQWCADYCDTQPYNGSVSVDPQGPANGPLRVLRGGAWDHEAWGCRAAYRAGNPATHRHPYHGFRVVCTAPLDTAPSSPTPAPPRPLPAPRDTGARAEVKGSNLTLDLGDSVKIEFARIPAGEFMMGDPDSEPLQFENTRPYHRVIISKDFYMGINLVTQEQYEKIMGINPSSFSANGDDKSRVKGMDTRRFPVERVSWEDAQQFCRKLSELTGHRCTLPTEAQWEYACRAGTTTLFHFGTSCNGKEANCNGNHPYGIEEKGPYLGRTCAVGSYPPNAFGLYDMHGNVWEWCADYMGNGNYKYHATVDPIGRLATEGCRVVRGGPWDADAKYCRAAMRYGNGAYGNRTGRDRNLGFRICLIDRATSSETPVPPRPLLVPPTPGTRAKVKPSNLTLDLGDSVKIEFARIPAGEFMMGKPDSEPRAGDGPQHRVRISKDFCMGIYPVTQEQFQKVMGRNPSEFSATGRGKSKVAGMDTRRFPVENASWDDAQDFCRKLSQLTGRSCPLPTEAQWEYACRAGTTTPFYFGNQANGTQGNCNGNHPYGTQEKGPYLGRTCPVGSYALNPFGLYDMHGNVAQWCADYYGEHYYNESPTVDPKGPADGSSPVARGGSLHTNARVLRGGRWSSGAEGARADARDRWIQSVRNLNLGFRVICLD